MRYSTEIQKTGGRVLRVSTVIDDDATPEERSAAEADLAAALTALAPLGYTVPTD